MDTNIEVRGGWNHEKHEIHENTNIEVRGDLEPRMDTNGHEY
mgnify:CR=1 FL=1